MYSCSKISELTMSDKRFNNNITSIDNNLKKINEITNSQQNNEQNGNISKILVKNIKEMYNELRYDIHRL